MKTSQRPTFEETYRNVVCNSAIYELKSERPNASYKESQVAAYKDRKNLYNLLDDLCADMSLIFGRKVKRYSGLMFREKGNSLKPIWPSIFFDEYSRLIPLLVERVISGLVQKSLPHVLRTGWINWSGWDATVKLSDHQDSMNFLTFDEAMEISPNETDNIPIHVNQFLKKLKITKFDYQPYFLAGSNSEKVLAIKLGCQWHDLAVARWIPDTGPSNALVKSTLMIVGVLGMIASIFFAIRVDTFIVSCLFYFTAILSALASALMGMLVSDHLRHLKV